MPNDDHDDAVHGDTFRVDYGTMRKLSRRQRRIAIARVLRPGVRRNGMPLSDVAVATRVKGATVAEVREVREEVDRNGFIVEEVEGPAANEEGA